MGVMTQEAIRSAFVAAVENKTALMIRHKAQPNFVKFVPHRMWPDGEHASGFMPNDSSLWPRTARLSAIEFARDVHHCSCCGEECPICEQMDSDSESGQ